jgi:hypothetical protein
MDEKRKFYYNSSIEKKVELIKSRLGLSPHEALGVSVEEYDKLAISCKYAKLLSFCKLNGLNRKNRLEDWEEKLALYRYFVANAPENEVVKICNNINKVVERTRKRKSIEAKIQQKKKEVKELQKMINKL